MVDNREYKGCAVVVRDLESDEVISKCIILDYDRTTMTITIAEKNFDLSNKIRVLLNIFHGDSIYEFMGTIRKMAFPPSRQISIYKGRLVSDRRAKRYSVASKATVEEIIFDESGEDADKLDPPADVILLNISTNGALIKTNCEELVLDSCFKLKVIIDGEDTFINTTIVRVNKELESGCEYGCRFNYIYE